MYSPFIVSESSWNTHWRIHLQTRCTKLPEQIFNPYRLLLKTIAIAKLLQWSSRWPLPMASFTASSMRMTLCPWHSYHSKRKCTSVALPMARRLQSTSFFHKWTTTKRWNSAYWMGWLFSSLITYMKPKKKKTSRWRRRDSAWLEVSDTDWIVI